VGWSDIRKVSKGEYTTYRGRTVSKIILVRRSSKNGSEPATFKNVHEDRPTDKDTRSRRPAYGFRRKSVSKRGADGAEKGCQRLGVSGTAGLESPEDPKKKDKCPSGGRESGPGLGL